jgi:hypothetical protein
MTTATIYHHGPISRLHYGACIDGNDPDAQPIRLGRRLYRPLTDADRQEIAGRDLACHCAIDSPCHANVLLAWANTEGIP